MTSNKDLASHAVFKNQINGSFLCSYWKPNWKTERDEIDILTHVKTVYLEDQ